MLMGMFFEIKNLKKDGESFKAVMEGILNNLDPYFEDVDKKELTRHPPERIIKKQYEALAEIGEQLRGKVESNSPLSRNMKTFMGKYCGKDNGRSGRRRNK